ncbi:MAG: hypothetical protein ABIO70_23245 [Pseudomonadota bacterium]
MGCRRSHRALAWVRWLPRLVMLIAFCWANPCPAASDRAEQAAAAFHRGPRRVALLVGVSHAAGGYPPIEYAAHDVVDMASALLDPDIGYFDEVRILADAEQITRALEGGEDGLRERVSGSVVGRPTRARIEGELQRLGGEGFPPDSLALVYLSGHGDLLEDEQYFVAEDTDMTTLGVTGLRLEGLRSDFKAIGADYRMLVKAFCHAGDFRTKGARPWVIGQVESEISVTSRAKLAVEDAQLQNDLYTYFFVAALTVSRELVDTNRDGAVSDIEAHGYAATRVKASGADQVPTMTRHQVLDQPLVLAGHAGTPELASLISGLGDVLGYTFSFSMRRAKGGEREPVQVADVAQVALPPGCYRADVRERATGQLRYHGPVCLGVDENVVVERLVDRRERWALRVGVGGLAVPADALREHLIAPGPALQVGASIPAPARRRVWLVTDVGLVGALGAGEEELLGARYAARSLTLTPVVAARWNRRLPMGDLSLGPLVGYTLGWRTYPGDDGGDAVPVGPMRWGAPLAGLRGMAELTPGYRWTFGASVDLWLYGVEIDAEPGARAATCGTLNLGRRF